MANMTFLRRFHFATMRILTHQPTTFTSRRINKMCLVARSQGTTKYFPPIQYTQHRCFASKKKSKKDKHDHRGKKAHGMELDDEEKRSIIDYDKMCDMLEQSLDHLKHEYTSQLAVRTSAGAFDQIIVETNDGKFPLIQLAQIAQKNPQLLIINMAMSPQYLSNVKTAIINSGMNVNPQQDGTTLFVPLPKVTREHRETLAKNAKTICDRTKEKIRNIESHFFRDLKKYGAHQPEDLVRATHTMIEDVGRSFAEKAVELMKNKQHELLGK